jgi:hypothetical protein
MEEPSENNFCSWTIRRKRIEDLSLQISFSISMEFSEELEKLVNTCSRFINEFE